MSRFDILWLAFAFMLMFEGLSPLLFPRRWRMILFKILKMSDNQVRVLGAISVVSGLALYWLIAS